MKTKIPFLLAAVLCILMSSCEYPNRVIPSGYITTQSKYITDYDAIDVSNAFTVYVEFSETEESIEIEADDNMHPYIEVKKIGSTLIIGLKNNITIRGNATMRAYITTREVIDYTASGASAFFVEDPIIAGNVDIHLSGASYFTADLSADHADAALSGASILEAEGTVGTFDVRVSGASNVGDYNLFVDYLDIELSGASNAYLTVNQELSVDASGASNVFYKGSGVIVYQQLSGASQITRVD